MLHTAWTHDSFPTLWLATHTKSGHISRGCYLRLLEQCHLQQANSNNHYLAITQHLLLKIVPDSSEMKKGTKTIAVRKTCVKGTHLAVVSHIKLHTNTSKQTEYMQHFKSVLYRETNPSGKQFVNLLMKWERKVRITAQCIRKTEYAQMSPRLVSNFKIPSR